VVHPEISTADEERLEIFNKSIGSSATGRIPKGFINDRESQNDKKKQKTTSPRPLERKKKKKNGRIFFNSVETGRKENYEKLQI